MNDFFKYFVSYYIDLVFGPLYVVQMAIFTLLITISLNPFRWNREGILIKILDLLLTFVAQILCFCLCESLLGSNNYNNYIVWPIVILIHCLCFIRYNPSYQIGKGLVVCIFIMLFPQISANLNTLLQYHMETNFFALSLTTLILLSTIWIVIFLLTSKEDVKTKPLYFILFLFILAFSIAIIVTDSRERDYIDYVRSHICVYILLLFLSLVAYYLFTTSNKYYTKQYESEALALKYESDKKITDVSKENLEELRKFRHDMKNQYRFMKTLIDSEDMEKFKKYFEELKSSQFQALINTNNEALNIALYEMHRKMTQRNINLIISSNDMSLCPYSNEKILDICAQIDELVLTYFDGSKKNEVMMDLSCNNEEIIVRVNFPIKEEAKPQILANPSKAFVDRVMEEDKVFLVLHY